MTSSPDQKYLAAAKANGRIEVIKVSDYSILRNYMSHDGWVNSTRFAISGNAILSGGTDRVLKSWNLDTGLVNSAPESHWRWINDLAIDPLDRFIVSVGGDRSVRFWDPCTLSLLDEKKIHRTTIWCADATERTLITGDEDGVVVVFALQHSFSVHAFRAHQNVVTSISCSPKQESFCTAGFDGKISVWDFEGKEITSFHAHSERVWSVCHIDNSLLASASADGSVAIWNLTGPYRVAEYCCDSVPLSLCFITNERRLAIGCMDGSLKWKRL